MAEKLTDRINGYMAEWIDEIDDNNGLIWDTAIFMSPDKGTLVYLTLSIPGAVMDTICNRGTFLTSPQAITNATLRAIVAEQMELLLQDRSRQLAESLKGVDLKAG